MKKILIIVGLLAISSVAAFAAPVKTSKAIPLSDTQMESVKGQAYLYVYIWNGSSYITYIGGQYIGPNNYEYQIVYSGGPQSGTYFY